MSLMRLVDGLCKIQIDFRNLTTICRPARRSIWILALAGSTFSQTSINLATQARNADFSGFPFTRPTTAGSTLPASCQIGQLYFNTASPPGTNLFGCTATNVWTSLGSSGSGVMTGLLASRPSTCTVGTLYFAADQPVGQQLYYCSTPNAWSQLGALGGSGALTINNGALDIVTSVVPRLAAPNVFTGLNTFLLVQIQGAISDPGCTSQSDIGKIWINTKSSSNTLYEVCLSSSGSIQWVTK